jgi:hypothetical protein
MLLPLLLILFLFLFLFLFLLLHADGFVVSHLFPAADIGVTASSILGTIVPQAETKMVPTATTMATTNKTLHGAPSTLPSNPCPREGEGKGEVKKKNVKRYLINYPYLSDYG